MRELTEAEIENVSGGLSAGKTLWEKFVGWHYSVGWRPTPM